MDGRLLTVFLISAVHRTNGCASSGSPSPLLPCASSFFRCDLFPYFLPLQMYTLVSKYLSYSTSVQTELKFEKRVFPAITLCHLNPVKRTVVNTTENGFYRLVRQSIIQLINQSNNKYTSEHNICFRPKCLRRWRKQCGTSARIRFHRGRGQ